MWFQGPQKIVEDPETGLVGQIFAVKSRKDCLLLGTMWSNLSTLIWYRSQQRVWPPGITSYASTRDTSEKCLIQTVTGYLIITARKRSCGKVMFLQVSVILFTGGCLSAPRGVSNSFIHLFHNSCVDYLEGCLVPGGLFLWGGVCCGRVSAPGGLLPGGPGLRGVSPPGGVPGGEPGRPLLRAVHILLECILVLPCRSV